MTQQIREDAPGPTRWTNLPYIHYINTLSQAHSRKLVTKKVIICCKQDDEANDDNKYPSILTGEIDIRLP